MRSCRRALNRSGLFHIGSVKSEVRILGTESEQGVVLLRPTEPVKNGDKVF